MSTARRRPPAHYFAFGSNMSSVRLRKRLPDAHSRGRGCLPGWRFVCNKSGLDGSAKANLRRDPAGTVWGVVYELPRTDLERLDAIEGGYDRIEVDVLRDDGRPVRCQSYASPRLTADPRPFDWYKALIVVGAKEHGLPTDYVAMLEALDDRPAATG